MSTLVGRMPAGAVDLGGSNKAASVGYPVGAIHFGPDWEDDSVQLTHKGWSQITDGMAKSIVRLECEAEELRAEVALLQEQARILAEERDEARKAFAIATTTCVDVQQRLRVLERERDEAREKAERYRNAMMAKLHELESLEPAK